VRSFLRSGRALAACRSHATGRGRTRYGRAGRIREDGGLA
jgi:hypothetical protein